MSTIDTIQAIEVEIAKLTADRDELDAILRRSQRNRVDIADSPVLSKIPAALDDMNRRYPGEAAVPAGLALSGHVVDDGQHDVGCGCRWIMKIRIVAKLKHFKPDGLVEGAVLAVSPIPHETPGWVWAITTSGFYAPLGPDEYETVPDSTPLSEPESLHSAAAKRPAQAPRYAQGGRPQARPAPRPVARPVNGAAPAPHPPLAPQRTREGASGAVRSRSVTI